MDDYDDTGDYAADDDDYHTEEEANGHDEDEEDVEQARVEDALYKSDDEGAEASDEEFEEDGILGIEKEQEDNVDHLRKRKLLFLKLFQHQNVKLILL